MGEYRERENFLIFRLCNPHGVIKLCLYMLHTVCVMYMMYKCIEKKIGSKLLVYVTQHLNLNMSDDVVDDIMQSNIKPQFYLRPTSSKKNEHLYRWKYK